MFYKVFAAKWERNYLYGIAWYLASLVVSVTNDALMKFFGGEYSVAQIVFLRYTFATICLLPVIPRGENALATIVRVSKLHLIRAMLLLLAMLLYCSALGKLPISTVTALNFVIPIFTLIFASVFLNEKITRGKIIATTIGFIGVCVVIEPSNTEFATFAAVTLLLSAALFAALDTINKKFVTGEGVFPMVFYTATITSFLAAPFATCYWIWPSVRDICLFAVLGFGANLLLYCILKAFEHIDVSATAPLRYLELVLSVAVGFVIFGEKSSKNTIFGALVIITSTLYIVFSEMKNESKT
ncbi:MAG: DMT family transporter [Puniceicoccales bacterium]|jgi:drug/metabolite transporter (DMT)-like permease|nr:DMT family transporter [Puniceicoccales bacterium]